MVAVPVAIPVTVPLPFTEAMAVLELLQLPALPSDVSVSIVVAPTHTVSLPVIVLGFTLRMRLFW